MEVLTNDPAVLILGVGVTDVKGIFGTTLAARLAYPDRVIETPLSELALTGACAGLALGGYKPILVHARADFLFLTFEHLVNTIAKWPYTSGGPGLPIVVRAIIGRGWGQGAQHSQAPYAMLAHVPGLRVVVPVTGQSYRRFLAEALTEGRPTIMFEPRRCYAREMDALVPALTGEHDLDIITIGDAVLDAVALLPWLAQQGIRAGIISWEDLSQPPPFTGRPCLVIDGAAPGRFGAGAEAIAHYMAQYPTGVPRIRRLGVSFSPCPVSAPLEAAWYISREQIIQAACKVLGYDAPYYPERAAPAPIGRDGREQPF